MRGTWLLAALVACGSPSASQPAGPDAPGGSGGDAMSPDAPGIAIPIKHVVIIVKENHTFDNYFGSFPGADGISSIQLSSGTITPPHAPDKTPRDLCHAHSCALQDLSGDWEGVSGATQNGDNLAFAQYSETDIPNYWQYARHFTLGDEFFANVLGPSFPGHTFVLAAQVGWATGNPDTQVTHPYWGCDQDASTRVQVENAYTGTFDNVFPCFKIPSVPDVLPAGVDWKFYGSNFYLLPEIWSMFDAVDSVRNGPTWSTNVVNANTFDSDVANGTLPAVSFLVNQDLDDEHPNIGGVCDGENWTVGHINALMQSDYWKDTAIIFTMDDFGGWYDHVTPPRRYGMDPTNMPYGLGFRLPLIVISPYSKQGIFHEVAEQASIPRFIERVFGSTQTLHDLDPAAQDAQANDLLGAFDFTQTPLPPLVLQTRSCGLF
jgi:phospholipase C